MKNRREEEDKKEFYKATDLLERVGSGKFDEGKIEIDKAMQWKLMPDHSFLSFLFF